VTRLLVIRHGLTDWNEAGLIQGRTDRPLSEGGRAALRGMSVPDGWDQAACLSSPLIRAMETARLLGLNPAPEPRLIEMNWGEWEGKSLRELRAKLGEEMAVNEAQGLDFRPPGGESPRDVQERLRPLLAGLDGPAIAATHKGVLRALYALATGWDMREKPPHRLAEGCAHAFAINGSGVAAIEQLNMPLRPRR
jgi:probable phosphoglycerate mutase